MPIKRAILVKSPTTCNFCGALFRQTASQAEKWMKRCPECLRDYNRQRRAKRKAAGNPVRSGKYRDPATRKQWEREYNKRDYVRVKDGARAALSHAIQYGKIKKLPCEICGCQKSEGHHHDYSKPLEVKWLCMTHHIEEHQRLLARGEK